MCVGKGKNFKRGVRLMMHEPVEARGDEGGTGRNDGRIGSLDILWLGSMMEKAEVRRQ